MNELMREKLSPEEKENAMVLSRNRDGLFVLSHAESRRIIQVDEHTAMKLMLLESLGETEKSRRFASRFMGEDVKGFRLDAALLAEVEAREQKGKNLSVREVMTDTDVNERKGHGAHDSENGRETGKENNRNMVLDAHITGIGAAGDFHLTARVQNEKSGEVREMKGIITGLDAALLRSDTNEEGKDGTVLRNAQALASENFEKGLSAAFPRNNTVTMKME